MTLAGAGSWRAWFAVALGKPKKSIHQLKDLTFLLVNGHMVTHGQWLYRCVQIHDKVAGTRIIACNEEIQHEIKRQLELGTKDLLDVDQYSAEINTNDLESGSEERQEYWLLAFHAAQKAGLLWRQQQLNHCRQAPVERGHLHNSLTLLPSVDGL
jgi:hypothetical protein